MMINEYQLAKKMEYDNKLFAVKAWNRKKNGVSAKNLLAWLILRASQYQLS